MLEMRMNYFLKKFNRKCDQTIFFFAMNLLDNLIALQKALQRGISKIENPSFDVLRFQIKDTSKLSICQTFDLL